MRHLIIVAALLAGGCATGAPPDASARPHAVEVVRRPDAPPAPDRITLTSLYWGRTTEEWSIPRGGEGRWSQADGSTRAFPVSAADFDRLRDLFRPYEGVPFECARIIADGPYGRVTWSRPGHEDQQLKWDAGCVSGDAADVFQRLDQAGALLRGLRDGA